MRSTSMLRRIMVIFTVIGLLDSIYLSWIKLANQETMCAGIGDCEVVNSSKYSEIGGIPIAVIGAVAYIFILLFLLIENRNLFWRENSLIYVFGFSLIGTIYSGYLTYLEIAVIHAICPFCVISAIAILIIFIISIFRLRQGVG